MEIHMKFAEAIALTLIVASSTASANEPYRDPYRVINQASELVPWCKNEAESRYVARNITPYQWAASYHDRSNILYVDGRLRVHGEDVVVRCRVARGAREEYATIEINDPTLEEPVTTAAGGGV
jgi:hypothetical protein